MTKPKSSLVRSNCPAQMSNTFDLNTGLISDVRASVEFSTDIDDALDEALKATFPASDPISSLRAA